MCLIVAQSMRMVFRTKHRFFPFYYPIAFERSLNDALVYIGTVGSMYCIPTYDKHTYHNKIFWNTYV